MRYVSVLGVILVAWAALSPIEAAAKGPSNGGNSGQNGGNWNGGNGGQNGGNWNGGNGNGNNWKWGSGYPYHGYGYGYGYVPYVAERPIYENPLFSGLPIKITNPAANGVTLSYTLNGVLYTIPPGYSQELVQDRSWVITFSRGGNFGEAQYGLEPGVYSFSSSDHGWDLYRGALVQSGTAATPSNPAPPITTPANPPAKP